MRIPFRVGALAPAVLSLTAIMGAAAADAQNQPEAAPADAAQDPAEAEIRFVPGAVVQELPAEPPAPTLSHATLDELVASIGTAEPDGELLCLAQAVYFEARGESLAGQLAVAQVVMNRAADGRFGSGYCGVVMQPAQFSFVHGGHIPAPNRGSSAWQRAKAVARIADEGQWQSEAGDALYFHARHVRPNWASARTTRATIERHVFYR
jgi:spore germination cell wall hydrolase CwlJ-like protein